MDYTWIITNIHIVHYGKYNVPHNNSSPDAGFNPCRGDKYSNWLVGLSSESIIRWEVKIKHIFFSNQIMLGNDGFLNYLGVKGSSNGKKIY